jgi:two-component sensor histidine kinase/CHASE1-domain containing sensor protein
MDSQKNSGLSGLTRPKGILALLAGCGLLLSLFVAHVETRRYRAIERLRIGETIDQHFSAVTDHLVTRENLAMTAATLFNPPPLATPRPFAQFGSRLLMLAPDVTSTGWLPQVAPAQADEVLKAIAESGVAQPVLRDADGKPVPLQTLDRPLYPIVDIVPDRARSVVGLDIGSFPNRLAAIRQARDTRAPARTLLTALRQDPDAAGAILLYAPVFGPDGGFLGVIGFGYKIDDLFNGTLGAGKAGEPFGVRIMSSPDGGRALFERPGPQQQGGTTDVERRITFAGRDLRFVYSVPRNLVREGLLHGVWIAIAGFCLTGAAMLLLGFLSTRANALAREVESRRSAEDRLKVLIHELNHRVRNVMTVAQAVVRLSFTSGYNLADVQKTCEGRLQALANAMTLLTAADWRSIGLRQLITEDIIPFSDRITASGPDIALRPRAGQTFALLLYELTTNAAKHGALSVPQGKVLLSWAIDRTGEQPMFRLTWRELGGPPVSTPTRRGFGELLVRRIAPRDVAGRSTVSYESEGFQYELVAPLKELIEPTPGKTKTD